MEQKYLNAALDEGDMTPFFKQKVISSSLVTALWFPKH